MEIQGPNLLRSICASVEVEKISRATTIDVSFACLVSMDGLRIRLGASSEAIDGDGKHVRRAVAKRLKWKACVAGGNATLLTRALAGVAGECLAGGGAVEAGGAVANIWAGNAIQIVGAVEPVEIGNSPGGGDGTIGRRGDSSLSGGGTTTGAATCLNG